MIYQSNPKSSGFRELTPAELFVVSGGVDEEVGEIIVTGNRDRNFTSISVESLSSLGIFGFNDFSFLGLGGGFLDSLFGGGGEPIVTVQIEPSEPEYDGEIIVTLPPFTEIPTENGVISVRFFPNSILGGGEYIAYEPVPIDPSWWGIFALPLGGHEYQPVEAGTYTVTYNLPTFSGSAPAGFSFTWQAPSYTFSPDWQRP